MKKIIISIVLSFGVGLTSGWHAYQYYSGVRMLDCTITESLMWLRKTEDILRDLDNGNIESAVKTLTVSMEKSITTFEAYEPQFCARDNAKDCIVVYEQIRHAKEYLKEK